MLSEAGEIHKVHGGAMPSQIFSEGLLRQRMFENVAAKRYIAQKARRMISPRETLFVRHRVNHADLCGRARENR